MVEYIKLLYSVIKLLKLHNPNILNVKIMP